MQPTVLVYSSHDRCEYLHRTLIVERALQSPDNKSILYLPLSMRERHQQQYGYSTFEWYFRKFEKYGLRHSPFYWSEGMTRADVDLLFSHLYHDQVVILGGGNSELGMWRYRKIGEWFYDDPDKFSRVLHERQQRGLLTVGFSAGADQLSQYLSSAIDEPWDNDFFGFSLARNIMVTLHHEPGRHDELFQGARQFQNCKVFGLPNDSGLLVSQGMLASGNRWQIIEFVIDKSWDVPRDTWHIKTRAGQKIEHFYRDGRHWAFNLSLIHI